MWQSVKILNDFNTLILKQIFRKTETSFKKLEYHFLVESTKIENASFPYKTTVSEANAISEINVKMNRMVSTKWTYHKEMSFTSKNFIFLKILFRFKNFLHRVDLWIDVLKTQMPIFLLSVSAGALFGRAFSLWVSLKAQSWVWDNSWQSKTL